MQVGAMEKALSDVENHPVLCQRPRDWHPPSLGGGMSQLIGVMGDSDTFVSGQEGALSGRGERPSSWQNNPQPLV